MQENQDNPNSISNCSRIIPHQQVKWSGSMAEQRTEQRWWFKFTILQCSHVYLSFSAFCKFVKQEVRIACDPVISSKTLIEKENKKEDVDRTPKGNKILRRKWGQAGHRKKQTKKRVMLILQRPSLHWLMQWMNEWMPGKLQFIRARGLCHGFLKWGHLHKDCH